jgi:hypothetical protein
MTSAFLEGCVERENGHLWGSHTSALANTWSRARSRTSRWLEDRKRRPKDTMIHVDPTSNSQHPIRGFWSSGIGGTPVGQRRSMNKAAGTRLPGKLPPKILPFLSLGGQSLVVQGVEGVAYPLSQPEVGYHILDHSPIDVPNASVHYQCRHPGRHLFSSFI